MVRDKFLSAGLCYRRASVDLHITGLRNGWVRPSSWKGARKGLRRRTS
ncbi:hypothetical protein KCP78_16170 [Salmonella enterica subsp. enterica]|nr:hypothetical protein KCP78_16170 [Salmonella enterica subsp. enterica]